MQLGFQKGRTTPLGNGNIAVRTKGDGQETPVDHEEFADKRPWANSQHQQYPAKPARRGASGVTPMGTSSSLPSVSGGESDVGATVKTKPTEQGNGQIPGHSSPSSRMPSNRRRVNTLTIRSLDSAPSDTHPPAYEKVTDSSAMPRNATYMAHHTHQGYDSGPTMGEAMLQKLQSSSRRRRPQYTPTFASRTPATDASPSSIVSSRTSSLSDLSTSYPSDNIYQGHQRQFPAHPASDGSTNSGGSHSQPSTGHHTPVHSNGSGSTTPTGRRPSYDLSNPYANSPNRQRSERTYQRRYSDEHIAPANIHTVGHFTPSQNDSIYATTSALLKAASAGSRTGVVMTEKAPPNTGYMADSPTSPQKERAPSYRGENNLRRDSSTDSLGSGPMLIRGTSNDSIRSLERLPKDHSSPSVAGSDSMGLYDTAISPMCHTISSGSIDSVGSSGIGTSSSPSIERSARVSCNMTTINESRTNISRSSSGSSLSTSSCTSLDASGNGQKRVVFGASSDRKKIKMNKEPPTIQEAKQAAIRSLTVGQVMEAAKSGNLAQLHRIHASAVQSGEQITVMRDAGGVTPLHRAAENGHISVVNFLLNDCGLSAEERKKATTMADNDYITACMLAVQNGHVDCVKVLVEVSQGDFETDDHGSTLLHLAAAFDQVECTEYIVEAMKQHELDPHVATDRGVTPAHVAAQKGSINCLRVLFDAGTQIQPDDEELTPIDWARKAGHGLCEHYLTVIQTCWALHSSLEEAETKLTKAKQQNRALEAQVAESQKQQTEMEAEIQKVKEDCDKRVKETKEDFAQLMTRMMEQVGGGKSALEEKMKVLNVGALFQTSPTSSGKKSKGNSPPVPPRTVTLPGSSPTVPSRTENKRANMSPSEGVRSQRLQRAMESGDMDEVMSVMEREQQLDSLNMSNIGASDIDEDDEE